MNEVDSSQPNHRGIPLAIVLGPLHSDGASGSVGDTTYQLWRGRWMVRSRPNPTQPQTTIQVSKQTILTTVTRSWKDLTEEQRDLWKQIAKGISWNDSLGQQHKPTGYNYYVKVNLIRLGYDESLLDEPIQTIPIWQTDQVITYDPAIEVFTVTPVIMEGDPDIIDVWATGPLTQSIQPRVPDWRQVGFSSTEAKILFEKDRNLGYWIRSRWGSLSGVNGVFFQDWMFAWTPSSIDSMTAWISAQDVTLNLGSIQFMNALEGTNGLLQAVPTKRPLLQEDSINGLPTADFEGIDDLMSFQIPATMTEGTFIMLATLPNDEFGTILNGFIASDTTRIHMNGDQVRIRDNSVTYSFSFPGLTAGVSIFSVSWSTTKTNVWINGSSPGSDAGIVRIRVATIMGATGLTSLTSNLAEAMLFDEYLSDGDRQSVEQYLSIKYDHPI